MRHIQQKRRVVFDKLKCAKQSYQYRTDTGCTGRYGPFRSLNGANSSPFRFVICFARHRPDLPVSPCFACTVRNFVLRSVHHFHPSSLAFSLLSFFLLLLHSCQPIIRPFNLFPHSFTLLTT